MFKSIWHPGTFSILRTTCYPLDQPEHTASIISSFEYSHSNHIINIHLQAMTGWGETTFKCCVCKLEPTNLIHTAFKLPLSSCGCIIKTRKQKSDLKTSDAEQWDTSCKSQVETIQFCFTVYPQHPRWAMAILDEGGGHCTTKKELTVVS